jgi:pimeloyl-ACP methyl ester carboxylesterase
MAHGLGTSSQIYDDYVQPLVSAGFSVLTYDYFNHGWSKSDDYFLNYNKHAIVDQLEDLLDHVMPNKDTPVFGWVGHSTGGCVGVLADANLKRKISNFFYISPAFFANKPLIAQLADQIPSIMRAFFRRNLLHVLIKDGYTENGEISWGRDSTTGKYLFHDKREEHSKKNVQMFAHHPLIIGGIFNVLSNILRQDLLFEYVELLSQSKARTLLTWGELDVVVPYNQKNIDSVSINPNVKVLGLKGLGHEGPLEDSSMIVPLMVDFFNEA